MRVLYVINGFDPGGAEHGLITLVENGAFDGHDLRVLALCRGHGGLADRIVNALGEQRVRFVTRSQKLTVWACVSGVGAVLGEAISFRPEKIVLSLKQANLVGRLAAIFTPWLTCAAFEHIAQYQARRLQGLYGPVLRLLSWRVDEIWADCSETLEQTRRYFLPRRRTGHVVPLFVAKPEGAVKGTYALSSPIRIAAAGRLVARKNIPLVIDAVTQLRAEGVEATLDVYGDGPQRARVEALIAEHDLRAHVALHGYEPEWAERVVDADVFLNLSDTEGFCIVVAEAMLAGLPVVAVDVGGIRDYGHDEENMLKLSAASAGAACAAINRIVRDEPLRERLGRRARVDMLEGYDPESCRSRVQEALHE